MAFMLWTDGPDAKNEAPRRRDASSVKLHAAHGFQQVGGADFSSKCILHRDNHFKQRVAAFEFLNNHLTGVDHFLQLDTVFTGFKFAAKCTGFGPGL